MIIKVFTIVYSLSIAFCYLSYYFDVPLIDYFNFGADSAHVVDDTLYYWYSFAFSFYLGVAFNFQRSERIHLPNMRSSGNSNYYSLIIFILFLFVLFYQYGHSFLF